MRTVPIGRLASDCHHNHLFETVTVAVFPSKAASSETLFWLLVEDAKEAP